MENEKTLNENAKRVWARKGNKLVQKYRCISGIRKGRLVNNPSDCNKPKDFKKRQKMKMNLAKKGSRMRRKAKRTKRVNPVSRMMTRMNKAQKRK